MNINDVSSKIASCIARELNYNNLKEASLVFGLELLLGAVIKTTCIMLLAWFFGIFRETLIIVMASGSLRIVSGGEHCSAFHRCLIGGTVVFLAIGFLSSQIAGLVSFRILVSFSLISFFLILIFLLKYAPGDTANKPITKEKEKKRYRNLSLLVTIVYFLILFILLYLRIFMETVFLITVGLLWQSFMITPLGYRFIWRVDSILVFFFKGGKSHGNENIDM